MEYQDLLVEKQEQITTITLNRPEKLNAITQTLLLELIEAVRDAEADDDVRCIVITGAGRGFSAGADLTRPDTSDRFRKMLDSRTTQVFPGNALSLAIETVGKCRKPIICAVNGVAVGAGLALLLACDIRYASDSARFSTMFTKRAMVVHAGMAYYLPRVVGQSNALEMLWTARFVQADEAEKIGLVNKVIPGDQLMAETMELAREIASGPTVILELDKKIIVDSMNTPDLNTVLKIEHWGISIGRETEDAKEGGLSFRERREPVFQGR